MRGLRLLFCLVGVATYLLIKHYVAAPNDAPSLHQGSSTLGGDKLELIEEADEVA